MCGISALILADSNGAACADLFESLGLLQHRGQVSKGQKRSNRQAYLLDAFRMLLVLSLVLPKVVSINVKEMVW